MNTIVGICGGSGSGKTTLAERLVGRLRASGGPGAAALVPFDAYYREFPHLTVAERAGVNWDHPDALDADLLAAHLADLRTGRDVAVPVYDFARYRRHDTRALVPAAPVIVVEGILLLAFGAVRDAVDLMVFRHCPESRRLERRLSRDVRERGRDAASVTAQFAATVRPMHERFVAANAWRADLVFDEADAMAGPPGEDGPNPVDTFVEIIVARLGVGSSPPDPGRDPMDPAALGLIS
ncbi:MAG: uridine kinase [Acidimicrobiales bacterium]